MPDARLAKCRAAYALTGTSSCDHVWLHYVGDKCIKCGYSMPIEESIRLDSELMRGAYSGSVSKTPTPCRCEPRHFRVVRSQFDCFCPGCGLSVVHP